MAKSKSLNLWTFIAGGIVGGAVAYMARGEIERLFSGIKSNTAAQQARINRYHY